jgi:16S rRNA (adenine1518-N6/adenine1519-N6)-dimethyltransferase
VTSAQLLGPAQIRDLASHLGVRPTKTLGQNFLHDPNTIRRIVTTAGLRPEDVVLEIGPGLGSLTLGLIEHCAQLTAIEIDPVLAAQLPATIALHAPAVASRLRVVNADALAVTEIADPQPTALVANLPYNVAVPILITMFERLPTLRTALVMVQAEVADRLAAKPGGKAYGAPSVKAAWFAQAERAGAISRSVFWPVPNVDSGLVRLTARAQPNLPEGVTRADVFTVIDAAFAQRRKMLRSALKEWAGSAAEAERILVAADVAPTARGETLDVEAFTRIAVARVS